MTRLIATLTFAAAAFVGSAGLVAGAGPADAEPCKMAVGNGQFAPCPPPIISTGPGDPSAPGHPAEEPTPEIEYEYVPLPLPWDAPPEP
ncbi:hypothetical protein [Gordonia terrae]|uniref:Uncharacterized protein n=2 Tax=Gordonia terrae TaxID=2055 RepID=A0AAD0K651_9ACTN|nr:MULTISPECIES: hypothetical protein [Gordonia]VTR10099.1 Uncharacterised protein [Clostridioides difficile]ANY23185.1 hypothetical protein BCM27_10605 [Gordonia terrae]AWO83913.1 hypothetical protein DLJ61_10695 [Gordonia terrae]VTS49144.1 Uncharacterised protein [Gordonia terrae]GAB42849.1 hypothetical protein GOTRE_026_01010 [Gordonia terrae NBRC 100016]